MEDVYKHCDELTEMLKAIREPGKAFFGTDHFHQCNNQYIYSKTIMCKCRGCHWSCANVKSFLWTWTLEDERKGTCVWSEDTHGFRLMLKEMEKEKLVDAGFKMREKV